MVSTVIHCGKPSRAATLLALGLGVAVLSVSCSNSGYTYVSSSDRNAYFKVPANWKFFDKRDLLVASGQSLSGESDRQFSWLIAFDADPQPSVQHVIELAEAPKFPVVEARVQSLPFDVRDQLSLESLRNWVYQVDRLVRENFAEILSYEDVNLDGGLHGIKMTFDVALYGQGAVLANNQVIWVAQQIVVDPGTNKLYSFMVRCESHCYRDNKALLDQIVDSWTVKER